MSLCVIANYVIWLLIDIAKSDELKAQFSLDKQQPNDNEESQQNVVNDSSKNEKEELAPEVSDSPRKALRRRGSKQDSGIVRRSLPDAVANNSEGNEEENKDTEKGNAVVTVIEQLVMFSCNVFVCSCMILH